MERSSLIPVGKVVKTHGVRGAVKILSYGETFATLGSGAKLIVLSPGGAEREITIAVLRGQRQGWIGEFEEIGDIEQAAALAGHDLCIPEDRLPTLPEGEFYHFQLIGLSVETTEGRSLGTLRSILETGSNDVYVVDGEKELLIPAIEDVVREIDLQNKRIIVDLPDGLE